MLYLLVLLLIVLAVSSYFFYIKPIKMMKAYRQAFEKAGYRVYSFSYNPLAFQGIKTFFDDYEKYGDCYKTYKNQMQNKDVLITNIGTKPFIRFLHPDLIKEMCNGERQGVYEKNAVRMKYFDRISGKGLISSEREDWKQKRKLMNCIFNFNFISCMTAPIQQTCENAFNNFEKLNQKNGIVQYKIFDCMVEIFSNVIIEGFLGGSLTNQKIHGESAAISLVDLVNDVHLQIKDPIGWLIGAQFLSWGIRKKDRIINQRIKTFDNWALDFLRNRIKSENINIDQQGQKYIPKDIISAVLLENRKLKNVQKQIYTQLEILAEFKTFFIAGTDTTSHLTQAMIYYIFKNPEIQAKLRSEIKNKISSTNFNYEDTKDMEYLQSIQKETLRLSGPANMVFARLVSKDHDINGIKMYKGTGVNYASIAVHYSAQYYKYPLQFRPQRWFNGECDNLNPFALVGFHAGPRSCIGKQLALLESKIALIKFVQRYKKVQILADDIGMHLEFLFSTVDFEAKMEKQSVIDC